ncbi:flavin reductase family protein [Carboxylicivirga sp. N1Y90]|uniref:flavin reductase family protein n=1 Tax=Carboxylicivirga fragile TaxID=3417571 RepID=UPI003D33E68B|nr:flavin reductase family protein [Marinilabiliaceae bacterium N1Y90]
MLELIPSELPVAKLFSYLTSCVAPRPIAFASTVDKDGQPNLSPFSFFNVFGANPPIVVFSPSRKGRDNTTKHTFDNVKEVPEVVINMVNYSMVNQVSLASNEFAKGVNEFEKAGFTSVGSDLVKPLRVKESPAQFECKVLNVIETGSEGGAGNLVVCEVLKIHIDESILDSDGNVDPQKADWVARMGKDFYCRASGDAVFEVEKPGAIVAMGWDKLPDYFRTSEVLTGNDLGLLANLPGMPNLDEIIKYREEIDYEGLKSTMSKVELRKSIHQLAKELIAKGEFKKALGICVEL